MLLYARHVCIQLSGVIPCLSAGVMAPLLTRLPESGHFLRVCWRHHVSLDPSAQVSSLSADVITSLLTLLPKSRHISLDPSAQVWSLPACLLTSSCLSWPFCPSLVTSLLTLLPKYGHFVPVCWCHRTSVDPSAQVWPRRALTPTLSFTVCGIVMWNLHVYMKIPHSPQLLFLVSP